MFLNDQVGLDSPTFKSSTNSQSQLINPTFTMSDKPASSPTEPPEQSAAFEKWRSGLAQFTGLGLSESEKAERERLKAQGKLEKDWDKCEGWKRERMNYSEYLIVRVGLYSEKTFCSLSFWVAGPMITFLLNHLKLAGCPFPSSALQCHPCPENRAGGFSPDHGILLCQDRFFNKKHMEDTLAHELIHAFDHCRFKVDWGNLRHHACSEVRVGASGGMKMKG